MHIALTFGLLVGDPRNLLRFLGRSVLEVQEHFGVRITHRCKHIIFLSVANFLPTVPVL